MRAGVLPLVALGGLLLGGCRAEAPQPAKDRLTPVALADVCVKGHVGALQDLVFENRVRGAFARREIWKEARAGKGEPWGELTGAACRVAAYTHDRELAAFLRDEALERIARGPADDWRAHALLALVDVARLTGDQDVLHAADRAATRLLTGARPREFSSDPMMRAVLALYHDTKKPLYLDFARGMDCDLGGGVELYRATGDVSALDAARRTPNAAREFCETVSWMRLNHELWLVTGEVGYVDALEGALYNSFLAGVMPGGAWCARSVNRESRHRAATPQAGSRLVDCCADALPMGFLDAAQTVAARDRDGALVIALYHAAAARVGEDELEITGSYPIKAEVAVDVHKKAPGKLRFRKPAWCPVMVVCGESACSRVEAAGWFDVDAPAGDSTWNLHFDMNPRLVRGTRAEVMWGPLLLAKSVKVGDTRADILGKTTLNDPGWTVDLQAIDRNPSVWGAWKATFTRGKEEKTLGVCDFASAATWTTNRVEFSVHF